MAKAKKSEASKTTPVKKAAAAKGAAGPAKAGGDLPAINTGLAASFAAKFVASRERLAGTAGGEVKESREFRQMKESLKNPAGAGDAGDVLHNLLGVQQKQGNLPGGHNRQAGGPGVHNQTTGATRTNVPRRTNG